MKEQKRTNTLFVCNQSNINTNFLCSGDKQKEEAQGPPTWILCFTSFNHLALVFNASVNFLIYFSCGNAFKRALLNALPLLRLFPRCILKDPKIISLLSQQNYVVSKLILDRIAKGKKYYGYICVKISLGKNFGIQYGVFFWKALNNLCKMSLYEPV